VSLRTEKQLQGVQEVRETFQGFTSPESSGEIAFSECKRGPKPSGFAEEAKSETFGTWKIFQEKEESVSSGRSYNYRQILRG
jgi:hypothetical protein